MPYPIEVWAARPRPPAAALIVVVIGVAAGGSARGATDAAKSRYPAARTAGSHKRAEKPQPIRFSCADALEDGTLMDVRLAAVLTEQAGTLRWEGGYGLPDACHREVHLICGPDLDHDGAPEAIVRIDWWQALQGNSCATLKSSADYWPVSYTYLATKHLATWRAVAPLAVGIFGDGEERQQTADFVRLPKHEVGIVTRWSNVSSENGCQIAGYQVFVFSGGVLEKTRTQDESPRCTPCCDPP